MKTVTNKQILPSILALLVATGSIITATAAPDHRPDKHPKHQHEAANLDEKSVDAIVTSYESVSAGLVQDDLDATKSSAQSLAKTAEQKNKPNIAKAAEKVASASTIDKARKAFKSLSSQMIALAKGDEDYTVMTCPMVDNGRWLQSSETVSNPYMGQKMPRCGMPESEKEKMKGKMEMKGMK